MLAMPTASIPHRSREERQGVRSDRTRIAKSAATRRCVTPTDELPRRRFPSGQEHLTTLTCPSL